MCGIVGYIGKRDAVPILMEGLRRLDTAVMTRRGSRWPMRAVCR